MKKPEQQLLETVPTGQLFYLNERTGLLHKVLSVLNGVACVQNPVGPGSLVDLDAEPFDRFQVVGNVPRGPLDLNRSPKVEYVWFSLGRFGKPELRWMESCWKGATPEDAEKCKAVGLASEIFYESMPFALVRKVTSYEMVSGPHQPTKACWCKRTDLPRELQVKCPRHGPPENLEMARLRPDDPQPSRCPGCDGHGTLPHDSDSPFPDPKTKCEHCDGSGFDPRG